MFWLLLGAWMRRIRSKSYPKVPSGFQVKRCHFLNCYLNLEEELTSSSTSGASTRKPLLVWWCFLSPCRCLIQTWISGFLFFHFPFFPKSSLSPFNYRVFLIKIRHGENFSSQSQFRVFEDELWALREPQLCSFSAYDFPLYLNTSLFPDVVVVEHIDRQVQQLSRMGLPWCGAVRRPGEVTASLLALCSARPLHVPLWAAVLAASCPLAALQDALLTVSSSRGRAELNPQHIRMFLRAPCSEKIGNSSSRSGADEL